MTSASAVGLALVVLSFAAPVGAQVLASWDPAGTIDPTVPLAASSSAPQVTASSLQAVGLTTTVIWSNAFVGDDWPSGGLDLGRYLTFAVTPDPGVQIALTSVDFSLYNNYDGTGTWEIRSSVDGFASSLDAGSFSGIFGEGLLVSADVSSLGQQSGLVELRLYTFDNAGTQYPLQRGIRGSAIGSAIGLRVLGQVVGADVTVDKDGVFQGNQIAYTISIVNNGPETATGLLLTDTLPAQTTYASDDCGGTPGPPWTWSPGPLANGASASCTLIVDVAPDFEGFLSNTASATGDNLIDTGDDSDTIRLQRAASVPALSEPALAALVGLLALLGAWVVRRWR